MLWTDRLLQRLIPFPSFAPPDALRSLATRPVHISQEHSLPRNRSSHFLVYYVSRLGDAFRVYLSVGRRPVTLRAFPPKKASPLAVPGSSGTADLIDSVEREDAPRMPFVHGPFTRAVASQRFSALASVLSFTSIFCRL